MKFGHEVRRLSATAVKQPKLRSLAIKSEDQQEVLALRQMRKELVKFWTAQNSGLGESPNEYGVVMPQGRIGMRRDLAEVLELLLRRLQVIVIATWREKWAWVSALDVQIKVIGKRFAVWHCQDAASQQLVSIPGMRLLSATAAAASMGNPTSFRLGREFAGWLGLLPRQTDTGGRVRMHGISKRDDRYLRSLLTSVLANGKKPPSWVLRLLERRPRNVVVVALDNKMARMIWALLAHGRLYQADHVSRPLVRVHPA